ncbi:MAG: hypothetical protein ABIK83_01340 [Candidatus Zixiibacteriota bacterium]
MSLLEFAREFARLKSDLAACNIPDVQLVRLVDFWPTLRQNTANTSYQSYVEELVPIILHLINDESLHDLTIDELRAIQSMLQQLHLLERLTPLHDRLAEHNRTVSEQLAMRYFYAGSIEDGLHVVAEMSGGTIQTRFPEDVDDLSEFEAFESVTELNRGDDVLFDELMVRTLENWKSHRESIYQDRILSLFVDRDDSGRAWRGRMKALSGKVELFGKSATTDEITFDNQIKSPDDPFIGVAYQSLEAVRQLMKRTGFSRQYEAYYHAHFAVKDSQQTFTGDSIGLAIGLLTYTQLLKPEILRQDNFIASDIAVTGSIDSSGAVTAVHDGTLHLKIERAFFSPVRHLIVPDANLSAAREHLDRMREKHPRRRLKLIGVESLSDAIENRNVIREERVGLSTYTARMAYHHTRSIKLQIPILLTLAYLLLCLIYPKAWVGFDWNPATVEMNNVEIIARNSSGQAVWNKDRQYFVSYEIEALYSFPVLLDADGDGTVECFLAFTPAHWDTDSSHCALFKMDRKGRCIWDTLFSENPAIGQKQESNKYNFQEPSLYFDTYATISKHDSVITDLVLVRQHNTGAFCQIICIDPVDCTVKGDYWHRGILMGWEVFDLFSDGIDDLLFTAVSNEHDCASLFAFASDDMSGMKPPYKDHESAIGNQLFYILFPRTKIGRMSKPMSGALVVSVDSATVIIHVDELDKGPMYYQFNSSLHCETITASSAYLTKVAEILIRNPDLNDPKLLLLPTVDEIIYFNGTEFSKGWATCYPYPPE